MIPSINPEEPSSSSSSDEDSEDEEGLGNEQEDDEAGSSTGNKTRSKGSGHLCPHCKRTFPFPNKLREHMRVHETGRYPCRECSSPKCFDTFFELRSHRKQFHSQAFHTCPQCPYTNSKPSFLRRHFQQNHIDGVPCTIDGCSLKVAKNRMKAHIKQMHSTVELIPSTSAPARAKLRFHKCPSCDYLPDPSLLDTGDQYEDLMMHIREVHDKKKRRVCSFGCGAILCVNEVNVHWEKCPKVNTEEPSSSTPRLVDDGCGDTNTVTSQSITTDTSYPDDCGSDTERGTIELLSNSLVEADLDEEEPPTKKMKTEESRLGIGFSCDVCKKNFTKQEYVRKHFNACHSKQKTSRTIRKKFTCERSSMKDGNAVCGKSYRTDQALQDHYNVHDGIKPYTCVTCDQKFYARDRFAVHLSKYHLTSIKDLNFAFGANESQRKEPSLDNISS